MKRRTIPIFLSLAMLFGIVGTIQAIGADTVVEHVDSVNGTRWANYICVYKDIVSTGQNEWGENIVVSADGKVTDKIPGGDGRGKDLAVPKGGMVVSGTGDVGKNLFASVDIGDNAYFDEYGMRVLFSKDAIDPFYSEKISFTAYNEPRYANTLIVYNKSGTKTETNGYGYEVCVDKDGVIISSGGNDNTVPDGGFVVSAIEPADRSFLKAFFITGAKCTISGMELTVEYNEEMLGVTVKGELTKAYDEIETAKSEYRLVDTDAALSALKELENRAVKTLAERDAIINEVKAVRRTLIEVKDVDVRAVWYVPLETRAAQVAKTVEKMASLGINQLCLGVSNGYKTFVQMPDGMPFSTNPALRKIDLLQEYVDNCKKYGIELILSISVFGAKSEDDTHPEWLAKTNTGDGGELNFYSPANDEFRKYFKSYVEHIITNYEIDGIQWDYIRYEGFVGNVDYGYDDASKKLFAEKTGLAESTVDDIGKKLRAHPNWNDWVDFKVGLVDSMVEELSELVREKRPDLYITACVANDTTRDLYFQDSTTWLKNNWVDGIYPMAYAEGIMGSATDKFSSYITDSTYLIMGNGAYLSLTMDEMYAQVRDAALHGADGIAFFEWGAYVDHQYADTFLGDIYKDKALSFTYNESESIKLLLERAKSRFEKYVGETEAFSDTSNIAALKDKLTAKYDYNESLYRDIDLALRIEKFSKEENKKPYTPDVSGDESADISSTNSAESADVSGNIGGNEKPGSLLWWLIAGGVAVLAGAVFVVALKKRGKPKEKTFQ